MYDAHKVRSRSFSERPEKWRAGQRGDLHSGDGCGVVPVEFVDAVGGDPPAAQPRADAERGHEGDLAVAQRRMVSYSRWS